MIGAIPDVNRCFTVSGSDIPMVAKITVTYLRRTRVELMFMVTCAAKIELMFMVTNSATMFEVT